jgi:hypothetical protein
MYIRFVCNLAPSPLTALSRSFKTRPTGLVNTATLQTAELESRKELLELESSAARHRKDKYIESVTEGTGMPPQATRGEDGETRTY